LVTVIVGAGVSVLAGHGVSALTPPAFTDITQGADVTIVAGSLVGHLDASVIFVTAIGCAQVSVVTVQGCDRDAHAAATDIAGKTCVAVVTFGFVIGHDASIFAIAGLVGTWVPVIATEGVDATDA